jgi:hypothetical protein
LCAAGLFADEGMWPFNQFPKDVLAEKHKFDVTPDFLDRLRLASVRLNGGSGSFVSPNGLLITNQHLAADCLRQHDALQNGFYAAAQSAELKCNGMQAEVLMSVEDVTSRVRGAATDKQAPDKQAIDKRNAAIARVEKECAEKSRNRCVVVTLFSGGRYDLYQYKGYGDLRLVFAPEYELAFFGRERDSITYLRYGLDIAFLRAYEGDKPAATPNYFKWSTDAPREDDLVLAVGNPAATGRLATAAQLTFYRDTELPLVVRRLQTAVGLVNAAPESAEKQAMMTELLASYKINAGKLIGLRDDRMVARKTNFESRIKRAVQASKAGTDGTKIWDEVANAYKSWQPYERPYQILEASPAVGSVLFRNARRIVHGAQPENATAINEPLEIAVITQYLQELRNLGEKDAPQKEIFGGQTPKQAAEAYVKGGLDGMVKLAMVLDGPARKLAKKHEEIIGTLETSAAEKIAQYRFKLFGAADYPDATGTPRVEFGVVKGYDDRAGITMPYASTFGGLFFRKDNQGPWLVPQRWVDRKAQLNLELPLDFVSTCDIGGGDYGSPTVNRAGELVGVTFDGNLESLPDLYLYTNEQARAVHVSTVGIAESLDKVYGATALLKELGATNSYSRTTDLRPER